MHHIITLLAYLLAALLVSVNAHAALRNGTGGGTMPMPTAPQPTNPTPPTGGGSPTLTCVLVPAVCVQ